MNILLINLNLSSDPSEHMFVQPLSSYLETPAVSDHSIEELGSVGVKHTSGQG